MHLIRRRRSFAPVFAALALGAVFATVPVPGFAQDFDAVEVKVTKVAQGVYMLTGAGGNLGLCAGKDGAFLIDDQYAPLTGKIQAAIATVTDEPVKFVLNTHWHGDHTGGNENLGKAGAVIFAHENVRRRMSTEQFTAAFNDTTPASAPGALPMVTFTDAVTFHMNGEDIRVFHVDNAHTDGDAMIHFPKANVLHMGDVYFNGLFPYIDVSAGGSVKGMLGAIEIALNLADENTAIIPGHGPLSNREELTAYRDMLSTVAERMIDEIKAGKSLEEVLAMKPTAEFDETLGGKWLTPDQFVSILYSDLSR
jgi:cyclase